MIATAAGTLALTSLRSLYDIAKDIRNSNDPEKLRIAAGQMFDLAIAAREQVAALQDERNAAVADLTALKTEVEKMQTFEAEAQNYERIRTDRGTFVYCEKGAPEPKSEAPKFCVQCFLNKKFSILQPNGESRIMDQQLRCGTCKAEIPGR
jgi:hypothetical protein